METRASYTIVGAFIVAATAMTLGFVVWIAGEQGGEDSYPYTIVFDRDISGLSLGSPVRYLGVDVGSLTAMHLIVDEGPRVAVEISVQPGTPMYEGTYASIAMQGITGAAYLNLANDPGSRAPLRRDANGKYPIIPTRDVGLAALLAGSGDITEELKALLGAASALLGEENRKSLNRALADVRMLTATLAGERETIAALPRRIVGSLDELNAVLGDARGLFDQAEPELLAAVSRLNETTTDIARLTGRLDGWLVENEAELDAFVASGLGELPGVIADARRALRELDKLAASLRENPSQIIYRPRSNAVEVER